MVARYFSTLNGPDYIVANQLYERQAVTDIWNKLTVVAKKQWKWKNLNPATKKEPRFAASAEKRVIQVYGPPGTGKTCAVYGWLDCVCKSLETQALWIDCQNENDRSCWLVDGTTPQVARGSSQTTQHAFPTDAPDDTDGYCVVVFDGVGQTMISDGRSTLAGLMFDIARTGVLVVLVSSEGVRLPDGQSNDVAKLRHFVPSWTKDEYVAACANDDFWQTTRQYFEGTDNKNNNQDAAERAKLVDAKFEVAGHSARFMFRKQPFLVKEDLQTAANAVDVTLLEQAIRQTASSGPVNTLVARLQENKNGTTPVALAIFPTSADWTAAGTDPSDFVVTRDEGDAADPQARIVSRFASEKLIKNLPRDINRLRSLAERLDNRAILGYAFEEQLK